MAGAAYSDNLCRFFSVALEHVVELNLTYFHFLHDLDLMKLLPKEALKGLHALSMSLCVLGCQCAAHHLLTAGSDLRELDMRIDRRGGELMRRACKFVLHQKAVRLPPSGATLVVRTGVAKLTVRDVPAHGQLWLIACCPGAVTVRLVDWPGEIRSQYFGYIEDPFVETQPSDASFFSIRVCPSRIGNYR
ncbi:hypothetical protein MRX96_032550 [Rhipicephalus microplus]